MTRKLISLLAAVAFVGALPVVSHAQVPAAPDPRVVAREVEPVVMTGAMLPRWSRLPAAGVGKGHTYGIQAGQRDAHAGTLAVPPDARTGVPVDDVAAYRWDGTRFVEIPVQVDERFPYFLANGNSDFGVYSGTDEELTYAWDTESWKKTAGQCAAQYPEGVEAMKDPAAGLDDDDEIAFMASDAGGQAPTAAKGPAGSTGERHEVRLVDPTAPDAQRFVYLFVKEGGSSFTADNGYVDYQRDANADQWIDQDTFSDSDPEKLGSSNKGYGPNLSGTVCTDDPDTAAVETLRNTDDRFPRDGVTVSTDTYKWRATGRWMVREMHVTKPGQKGAYGPDLVDRWKGRAFQQAPDSTISVVGFEDEQVNWEANSALLGELEGPVRAIRETWGADSGTNVTKTETFYRDSILYRYHVRVHPIPPDGLYTSWDYNHDAVSTYYNELKSEGVPIDGVNDDVGNVDQVPATGQEQIDENLPPGDPAFFDVNDPTFNKPLSFLNWEQVAGRGDNGPLVYMFQMNNAQSLENPLVVPYYRDDACLDDGTGDNPSPRSWPGESHEWIANNKPNDDYLDRPCYDAANPQGGPYRQGAFGSHGVHYFVTNDTDNTFSPVKTTEIDGQQWQWAAPTASPTNVGDRYANTAKTPLVPVASFQPNTAMKATSFEVIGATSGQATDAATLAARLTDSDGPVSGAEVTFTLGDEQVGKATTDSNGVAQIQRTLHGPARDSVLTVAYAGDADRAESSATTPFSISLEDTALTLTGKANWQHTLTAKLVEIDAGPLAGRVVQFSNGTRHLGSATTDSKGIAVLQVPFTAVKVGQTVTAKYAGDNDYAPSSAQWKRQK